MPRKGFFMLDDIISEIELSTKVEKITLKYIDRETLRRGVPSLDQIVMAERISNEDVVLVTDEERYAAICENGRYWTLSIQVKATRLRRSWEMRCPGDGKCVSSDRGKYLHDCKIVYGMNLFVVEESPEECLLAAKRHIADNRSLFYKGT